MVLLRPDEVEHWRVFYRFLTSLVQPRPIAWVSSLSADGVCNLAPFSFFNVVCANPPTVLFCPMVGGRTGLKKDTLRNVEETKEFVVNIVSRSLAEAMNLTSAEVSSEIDEFDLAGLKKKASHLVAPPKVELAKAHLECLLDRIIPVGEGPGSGAVVLGRVVLLEVDDSILVGDDIDVDKLAPIGRLSGSDYCHVENRFSLERPSVEALLEGLSPRSE